MNPSLMPSGKQITSASYRVIRVVECLQRHSADPTIRECEQWMATECATIESAATYEIARCCMMLLLLYHEHAAL